MKYVSAVRLATATTATACHEARVEQNVGACRLVILASTGV